MPDTDREKVAAAAADLHRAIYTTNPIESLNYQMRKIIKNRGCVANDEAVGQASVAGHLRHRSSWWPSGLTT